jgi:hypothetical protein
MGVGGFMTVSSFVRRKIFILGTFYFYILCFKTVTMKC